MEETTCRRTEEGKNIYVVGTVNSLQAVRPSCVWLWHCGGVLPGESLAGLGEDPGADGCSYLGERPESGCVHAADLT